MIGGTAAALLAGAVAGPRAFADDGFSAYVEGQFDVFKDRPVGQPGWAAHATQADVASRQAPQVAAPPALRPASATPSERSAGSTDAVPTPPRRPQTRTPSPSDAALHDSRSQPRQAGLSALWRGGGLSREQRALQSAYPGAFAFEGNEVVFPDGTRLVWDDGRTKSPAELLASADLEDMFAYDYPIAARGRLVPARHEDPGRVRNDAFFKALYGASAGAVRADTRQVPWVPALGGGSLTVTTRFGVADRLARVSAELERLPARFHKHLVPSAGAFLWRPIAGTNRMSVHSFGAAVDVATTHSSYWRWDGHKAGATIPYRNEIPMEIVEVFEKHCFIWGGRWHHYDTMHFEYRPELLPHCH
ncbi:M15 family metallopeptidase [Acuticoccus sp.]|uniref:M15 family metallopeptidase n=1 Tax=Acuticoccus sp. TaxID=1904378 RepID=UPI003B52846A